MASMGGRGEVEEEEEEGSCCDDDDHHLLRIISEDVLIQILLYLPIISLLRFKSVCKSWRSIIESPFFIYHHYHHHHATATATATTEDDSFIFDGKDAEVFDVFGPNEGKFFKVSGVGFDHPPVFEDLGRPPLLDLGEQFACLKEWFDFLVVGCCNGIICLHDYLTRNVALWNPATKQSRVVPKPPNPLGGNPHYFEVSNDQHVYWAEDFVRFGIDIKTNDYKLLLITSIKIKRIYDPPSESSICGGERRRVHVYSLSTDSWRCIDAPLSVAHPDPILIERVGSKGLYLNGSYFFTPTYFNEDIEEERRWMPLFLSFDFTREIFRTIQPPFDLRDIHLGYPYFICFGEKLALVDAKKEDQSHYWVEYDIWVLKNEQHGGVKEESWTKFTTIASPDRLPSEPECITKNGEFAISVGWYSEKDREREVPKLELLSLITGEKKILWCGYGGMSSVHVYKPSLVPTGGNGATHNSRLLELDGTP